LILSQASDRSDRYGASARLEIMPSHPSLAAVLKHLLPVAG
jgi:hypothetical protein